MKAFAEDFLADASGLTCAVQQSAVSEAVTEAQEPQREERELSEAVTKAQERVGGDEGGKATIRASRLNCSRTEF